ncbi:hypothetical protein GCM10027048_10170 [Hymenobacter coalescens]
MLAVACTFSACKKDEEKPKTKTELLTAKSWRVTAARETVTTGGQTTSSDEYATFGACEKDDFVKFLADKKVEFNEGATKCNTADPQTETGAWDFNSDQTKLTLTDPDLGLSLVYDIVELNASTLKVKYSVSAQGSSYTTETTFTSF